jgi:hypothetical protein
VQIDESLRRASGPVEVQPDLTHLAFEGYLSVLLPRGRWTGF